MRRRTNDLDPPNPPYVLTCNALPTYLGHHKRGGEQSSDRVGAQLPGSRQIATGEHGPECMGNISVV